MPTLLGLDIGTSAAKAIAIDEGGTLLASASASYPLSCPRAGWSEQNPADWLAGATSTLRQLAVALGPRAADVRAIGLSGQMHGLVLLDAAHAVLRPAILWNDQRTAAQCARIESLAGGKAALVARTGNAALPGFTAPKVLWVREHEPDLYKRATLAMLPKDFVRLMLTGDAATDVGDASGTMLFDARTRRWNAPLMAELGIDPALWPRAVESAAPAGTLRAEIAREFGLPAGIPVAAGSGDNMAGAIGAGIVHDGAVVGTIGTSGVVYAHTASPRVDAPLGRTHVFCAGDGDARSPGGWCITGCTLSAGGSLQWLRDALFPNATFDELLADAATAPPGCEGLLFLPYLSGERAPHPDPDARGAFVGLSLRHTRAHLVRAVLEGVTFTMGQILDIHRALGVRPTRIRIGGGGAKSALWRQMQADVYGVPVVLPNTEEGPALGAAIMGGVAAGVFAGVREACDAIITDTLVTEPRSPDAFTKPRAQHAALYADLRERFAAMAVH